MKHRRILRHVADHRAKSGLRHAIRAYWNDTAAVALMVVLGFDTRAIGHDNGDALHRASFLGNAEMRDRFDDNGLGCQIGGAILRSCSRRETGGRAASG